MTELVCHQNRLASNLKSLESLYVPNFVRETGLGSLSSRYQRCHQSYFKSFAGGLPGIDVSGHYLFFDLTKRELILFLARGYCQDRSGLFRIESPSSW